MFRLTQLIRNLYLRLEGWIGVIFKSLFGVVGKIFDFFGKLFGFSKPGYFLESDEATGIQRNTEKEPIKSNQTQTPPEIPTTIRRRPQAKMDDYYLNMARDVQKS